MINQYINVDRNQIDNNQSNHLVAHQFAMHQYSTSVVKLSLWTQKHIYIYQTWVAGQNKVAITAWSFVSVFRIKIGNNLFAHSRSSWAAFFARHFFANRFDFYAGGCVARVYIVRAMFKIYWWIETQYRSRACVVHYRGKRKSCWQQCPGICVAENLRSLCGDRLCRNSSNTTYYLKCRNDLCSIRTDFRATIKQTTKQ